jgi:hypothetical protein
MLRRLRTDERGIALMMALGLMIVLGIVVTAGVSYTTSNTRSSATNQVRVSARQVAEAGMNAAIGALAANPTDTTALPTTQATARSLAMPGGTATYWADAYDTTNSKWTIHAIGTVANPSGVGGNATTQLNAVVPVNPSPLVQSTPPASSNPWAFMWATRTGTAGGCDETINTQVGAPMVVMGALCLDAPSTLQTGITSGPLYVKAGGSSYGVWNKKIYSKIVSGAWTSGGGTAISGGAHIAGNSCKNSYNGTTGSNVHTCVKSLQTAGDNIYSGADSSITGLGSIVPPIADFDHYYTQGSPGPYHPCNTALSTGAYPAATILEDETTAKTRNHSVSTVFNLTPKGAAYDCIVGSSASGSGSCSSSGSGSGSGQSFGEIIWDGTSKLEVRGTAFFDGSVSISNTTATTLTYTCYGSIYASGTILLKNTYVCGKYFDPSCTGGTGFFGGWLPFAEWLFLVADGDGGDGGASSQGAQIPAGVGIKFIASRFQGGIYSTKGFEVDATSAFEGPAVASNLIFDGNYTSVWGTGWQSANCGYCSTMPAGTPGISQDSKTQIQPPIYG